MYQSKKINLKQSVLPQNKELPKPPTSTSNATPKVQEINTSKEDVSVDFETITIKKPSPTDTKSTESLQEDFKITMDQLNLRDVSLDGTQVSGQKTPYSGNLGSSSFWVSNIERGTVDKSSGRSKKKKLIVISILAFLVISLIAVFIVLYFILSHKRITLK